MTFTELWDTKVSKLAKACVPEQRLVELLGKDESYKPSKNEKKYLEEMGKKYKDPCVMFYISDMCWRVEHALADNRQFLAELAVSNIKMNLDNPEYFNNVFGGDGSSDEWKNLDALRKGLRELLETKG